MFKAATHQKKSARSEDRSTSATIAEPKFRNSSAVRRGSNFVGPLPTISYKIDPEYRDNTGHCGLNPGFDRGFNAPAAQSTAYKIAQAATAGAGKPLPAQKRIQRGFGAHDISTMQTYTGRKAKAACNQLGAKAFTTKSPDGRCKIAFNTTTPDLRTQAHEAAHGGGPQSVQLPSSARPDNDPYEQQADAIADTITLGRCAENMLGDPQDTGGDGSPNALNRGQNRVVQRTLWDQSKKEVRDNDSFNKYRENIIKQYMTFAAHNGGTYGRDIVGSILTKLVKDSSVNLCIEDNKLDEPSLHILHDEIAGLRNQTGNSTNSNSNSNSNSNTSINNTFPRIDPSLFTLSQNTSNALNYNATGMPIIKKKEEDNIGNNLGVDLNEDNDESKKRAKIRSASDIFGTWHKTAESRINEIVKMRETYVAYLHDKNTELETIPDDKANEYIDAFNSCSGHVGEAVNPRKDNSIPWVHTKENRKLIDTVPLYKTHRRIVKQTFADEPADVQVELDNASQDDLTEYVWGCVRMQVKNISRENRLLLAKAVINIMKENKKRRNDAESTNTSHSENVWVNLEKIEQERALQGKKRMTDEEAEDWIGENTDWHGLGMRSVGHGDDEELKHWGSKDFDKEILDLYDYAYVTRCVSEWSIRKNLSQAEKDKNYQRKKEESFGNIWNTPHRQRVRQLKVNLGNEILALPKDHYQTNKPMEYANRAQLWGAIVALIPYNFRELALSLFPRWIKLYTDIDSAYQLVNRGIFDKRWYSRGFRKDAVNRFKKGLAKEIPRARTSRRATDTRSRKLWRGEDKSFIHTHKFEEGQPTAIPALFSASLDIKIARAFAKDGTKQEPTSLMVILKHNTGADVSTWSDVPRERETLFTPGIRMITLETNLSGTSHTAFLVEVPEDLMPPRGQILNDEAVPWQPKEHAEEKSTGNKHDMSNKPGAYKWVDTATFDKLARELEKLVGIITPEQGNEEILKHVKKGNSTILLDDLIQHAAAGFAGAKGWQSYWPELPEIMKGQAEVKSEGLVTEIKNELKEDNKTTPLDTNKIKSAYKMQSKQKINENKRNTLAEKLMTEGTWNSIIPDKETMRGLVTTAVAGKNFGLKTIQTFLKQKKIQTKDKKLVKSLMRAIKKWIKDCRSEKEDDQTLNVAKAEAEAKASASASMAHKVEPLTKSIKQTKKPQNETKRHKEPKEEIEQKEDLTVDHRIPKTAKVIDVSMDDLEVATYENGDPLMNINEKGEEEKCFWAKGKIRNKLEHAKYLRFNVEDLIYEIKKCGEEPGDAAKLRLWCVKVKVKGREGVESGMKEMRKENLGSYGISSEMNILPKIINNTATPNLGVDLVDEDKLEQTANPQSKIPANLYGGKSPNHLRSKSVPNLVKHSSVPHGYVLGREHNKGVHGDYGPRDPALSLYDITGRHHNKGAYNDYVKVNKNSIPSNEDVGHVKAKTETTFDKWYNLDKCGKVHIMYDKETDDDIMAFGDSLKSLPYVWGTRGKSDRFFSTLSLWDNDEKDTESMEEKIYYDDLEYEGLSYAFGEYLGAKKAEKIFEIDKDSDPAEIYNKNIFVCKVKKIEKQFYFGLSSRDKPQLQSRTKKNELGQGVNAEMAAETKDIQDEGIENLIKKGRSAMSFMGNRRIDKKKAKEKNAIWSRVIHDILWENISAPTTYEQRKFETQLALWEHWTGDTGSKTDLPYLWKRIQQENPDMTQAEMYAIKCHSGEGSKYFNPPMYMNKTLKSGTELYLRAIASGLQKLKPYKGISFRGETRLLDPIHPDPETAERIERANCVRSTSMRLPVGLGFLHGGGYTTRTLMIIKGEGTGRRIAHLCTDKVAAKEDEVLYPLGSEFKVKRWYTLLVRKEDDEENKLNKMINSVLLTISNTANPEEEKNENWTIMNEMTKEGKMKWIAKEEGNVVIDLLYLENKPWSPGRKTENFQNVRIEREEQSGVEKYKEPNWLKPGMTESEIVSMANKGLVNLAQVAMSTSNKRGNESNANRNEDNDDDQKIDYSNEKKIIRKVRFNDPEEEENKAYKKAITKSLINAGTGGK
ncbi:MAG: hypothetical protein V3T17_14310 [Pseudomonadales bacterium]